MPEHWLRGPVAGVPALLQPVAQALLQSRDEIANAAEGLTPAQLWARPGGAASAGFHLKHLAGSLDRLLTYARGEGLSDDQRNYLASEGEPGDPPADASTLVAHATDAVTRALEQVRATPEHSLLHPRSVGRQGLPSNVLGLLFHAAEHTTRHTGQFVTTTMVVREWGDQR